MTLPRRVVAVGVLSLASLALGSGCAASEEDEDTGSQADATTQLGTDDFCGNLFRVDSRAPQKIGDKEISYDWVGRVSAIGDARVAYNFVGQVSSVGDEDVRYGFFTVSKIGDRVVERNLRARIAKIGDKAVGWSLVHDRPDAIGSAALRYDLVGHLDTVGGDDVSYGWSVRTVTPTNRFALCLAVYLHAASKD